MAIEDLFIDMMTVQRADLGDGSSAFSHLTETFADHLTGQACRLVNKSSRKDIDGRVVIVASHKILCSVIDVRENDHCIIDGQTFDVGEVRKPKDGVGEHHMTLMVTELR